jgi:leucyl aminopeptidase
MDFHFTFLVAAFPWNDLFGILGGYCRVIKSLHMQVHFIVAACENMISGTGMRPGDVVTASNGKTIEVRVY